MFFVGALISFEINFSRVVLESRMIAFAVRDFRLNYGVMVGWFSQDSISDFTKNVYNKKLKEISA